MLKIHRLNQYVGYASVVRRSFSAYPTGTKMVLICIVCTADPRQLSELGRLRDRRTAHRQQGEPLVPCPQVLRAYDDKTSVPSRLVSSWRSRLKQRTKYQRTTGPRSTFTWSTSRYVTFCRPKTRDHTSTATPSSLQMLWREMREPDGSLNLTHSGYMKARACTLSPAI